MPAFTFFGGKGGVGKTTVSTAYAMQLARGGARTLIVSTDPAHSVGDLIDQPVGADPVAVESVERLDAQEIDPQRTVEEHRLQTKRELRDQVSAGLVREIDAQIDMAHQGPGAHEAALMDELIAVMRGADAYEQVIFDTAPTGGTLRLLALPELLEAWIGRLREKREKAMRLYDRAAIGKKQSRRQREGDVILQRLRERRDRFRFARETLRSAGRFILVANPDALSVRESTRAVEQLSRYDLPVAGVVVNRITPTPPADERGEAAAFLRERVAVEAAQLQALEEAIDAPILARVPTIAGTPAGAVLEEVGDALGAIVEPPHDGVH
ncbi:MAG: ArsA family ATPase [Haloferacaceae archaeon]|jgi:arsenite efflux ATP-binding protein ArsA (TC 3.A.4.1.1)|nr:ArsA family ATPase [Haloferacaceae archaeon]